MNELNTKCFRSQKREGYLGIYLVLVIMFYLCYNPIMILVGSFNNLYGLLTGIIGLIFILWIIFNLIREHFIFKCNFISNYKIIKFHSLIYHKIINWDDVENIEFDVMVAILSYLPYMETRCIILNLKNGKKYYIPLGGYDNIDDFKKYLNENFSDKILN